MTNLLSIIFATIFVNNYVFAQFLGICPSLGVTSEVETSIGMGAAVTFVIVLASVITYFVQTLILVPFDLMYLRTIAFILVIAALVQLVEMFLKKSMPALYQALGIYLPLITTNCIVLGVAILNVDAGYTLIESAVSGLGASIGFTMAIVLLAAVRESYDLVPEVPAPFRKVPLAFITLGLMSLAFSGFTGMFS